MMAGQGRTPTDGELADARRSARLAAAEGFPLGVCPYDPRKQEEKTLAEVWAAAYADASPSEAAGGGQGGGA